MTTVWLEVIRVLTGILILLALITLFKLFKNTKVMQELNLIFIGFSLYTLQAAIGAWQLWGHAIPIVWNGLELDELLEAAMYLVFVIAVVRLKAILDLALIEKKFLKALRELFR